jgi:threonine dehydrogenase-like Zn-dependent dehydrogenase
LHRSRGDLLLISVTPSHEISGVVDEIGPGVASVVPRDRVCVERLIPCGSCRYYTTGNHQLCSNARLVAGEIEGGFAERIGAAVPLPVAEVDYTITDPWGRYA